MSVRDPHGRLVFGRDDVLDDLGAVLSRVSDGGDGAALCLIGPPGIGKTTVARALVARHEAGGGLSLLGRSAPPPSAPLRALGELVISAIAAGADLAVVDETVFGAAVRSLIGEPVEGGDLGRQALMIGEGLRVLLSSIERRVVCVLEDLHSADGETLAVLDYLFDHLDGTALVFVATMRRHEQPAADAAVDEWVRRGVTERMTLSPLTASSVQDMVASMIDAPPPAFVTAVIAASEGSPLLVEEFARNATGDDDLRLRVPTSYVESVHRRMSGLGESEQTAIRLAALVGYTIDEQLLRRLGSTADAARAASRAAVRAQLAEPGATPAEPVRFNHALTRDAIVESAGVAVCRDLGASALATVDATGEPLDLEIASRLATVAGNERRASELLIEAARRAIAMGATSSALAHLDSAASLGDADALHGPVIREYRVQALAFAGRADDALRIGEELAHELEDSHDLARLHRIHLALARAEGGRGEWSAAARRLDTAFDSYERAPDAVRSLRAIAAIEVGDVTRARSLAVDVLRHDGVGGAVECEAHEVLGRVARETSYQDAAEHFRRGVEAASTAGLGLWRARSLLELGLCEATLHGRPDTFEQASTAARASGAVSLSAMCDYNLANLRGLRFEGELAVTASEQAVDAARQLGAHNLEALGWVTWGQAQAVLGSRAKARLAADRALDAVSDDTEIRGLVDGMCTGWSDLLAGDLDAAAGSYARSLETLASLAVPTATSPWYAGPVVLAVVNHPLAVAARAQLATPSFAAVPTLEAITHVLDAIAAGRAGDTEGAGAKVADARLSIARHRGIGEAVSGVWHLLWSTAAVAARRDGWGDPLADLSEAEAWFRHKQLDSTAAWCASQLRESGVATRRRGRSRVELPDGAVRLGITRREYEVLLLLGERLTNRQIAERLTVSPSTVKTHVERLLAKSARRNRAELAELAAVLAESAAAEAKIGHIGR